VSLSHFRGRTFENAVCIIDEFQNLTKAQLQMCVGRLGKGSIMIFTGDLQQIDLKIKSDSAIHDIPKIEKSGFVNKIVLTENHRHEALNEILKLLNEY
jgi:PhoH-like ATPase